MNDPSAWQIIQALRNADHVLGMQVVLKLRPLCCLPPATLRAGGLMGDESLAAALLAVCFTFSTGVGSSSNLQLQHSSAVLPGTCLATCCQKLRWLGFTVR